MKLTKRFFPGLYRIFGRNTFSQAGEDAVLEYLWYRKGIKAPKYLEIGVCDPRIGNNTYLYTLRGGKGVLVEANPSIIGWIKRERPRDLVINMGVATDMQSTEAEFYIFDIPAINTFNKEEAQKRIAHGRKLLNTIKVPLITINTLIEKYFSTYPDYLSIDIEGLDYDVLANLDYSRFPIPVICVETCSYSEGLYIEKDTRFKDLLESNGYMIYADTFLNSIFVHKEWFNKN